MIPRVIVLAVLVSAGRAGAETCPKYGGKIEATLLGAPVSLDPVAVRTHAESTTIQLIYDTLYQIGVDGVPQPHLAASAPVFDEKRTTARIELRKGVKFHDGTALTAQDVAASIERARTMVKWLLPIVASARADGDAIELALLAPASAGGDEARALDLPTQLALPQLSVTRGGKPPGGKPIGSGPFAIEQIDLAHHRLTLRAFDDHFAGRPYVEELELRWYDTPDGEARRFETGNAHVSARGVSAFAGGQPTFRADDVEGPAAVLAFVGFGSAHASITRDASFRRALDLALARGGLTTVGSGERVVPTRVPVPIEAGAAPLDATGKTGDLVAARAELAGATKRVPELAKAALEILIENTRPDDRDLAERVGLAFDRLGISWTITAVSAQVMRERVARGQCDLWLGQLVEPVTSQPIWWAAAFAAGGDDWPIAALKTGVLDPVAAAKAFAEREPIVPLMFRSVRLWHRTDLRGVAFDASGRPCFADVFLFGMPTPTKGHP